MYGKDPKDPKDPGIFIILYVKDPKDPKRSQRSRSVLALKWTQTYFSSYFFAVYMWWWNAQYINKNGIIFLGFCLQCENLLITPSSTRSFKAHLHHLLNATVVVFNKKFLLGVTRHIAILAISILIRSAVYVLNV